MFVVEMCLNTVSSLTSVLNTAGVYRPFSVLITEKQLRMDLTGWLETPSGMLIGMGRMSVE